jgi:hypothetical protein
MKDAGKLERFTEAEARQKIGQCIQTDQEFAGVPRLTFGNVVNIHQLESGKDEFHVVVKWELPHLSEPKHDQFAKNTYSTFLREIL